MVMEVNGLEDNVAQSASWNPLTEEDKEGHAEH